MSSIEDHEKQAAYGRLLLELDEYSLFKELFRKEPISRAGVQKEIEKRAKADKLEPHVWCYFALQSARTEPTPTPVKLHLQNQAPNYKVFNKEIWKGN